MKQKWMESKLQWLRWGHWLPALPLDMFLPLTGDHKQISQRGRCNPNTLFQLTVHNIYITTIRQTYFCYCWQCFLFVNKFLTCGWRREWKWSQHWPVQGVGTRGCVVGAGDWWRTSPRHFTGRSSNIRGARDVFTGAKRSAPKALEFNRHQLGEEKGSGRRSQSFVFSSWTLIEKLLTLARCCVTNLP